MPIVNKGFRHDPMVPLHSSVGNFNRTTIIKEVDHWLDTHPEATTTVEDGSITTSKLADDAVTTAKMADGSVTTTKLDDDVVTHNKMADASVGTDELIDGSVTTSKLDDGIVTTTKLANNVITHNKMAVNSVDNDNMRDASIGTVELIDGSVTTDKLADEAVTSSKLAHNAIPTMNATTRGIAKVGAGLAVNNDTLELDGDGDIATAVTDWLDAHPEATTTVADNAITLDKIADNAIMDAKLSHVGVRGISEDFLMELVDFKIVKTWRDNLAIPYRGLSAIDVDMSYGTVHVTGTASSHVVIFCTNSFTGIDSVTISGCPSGGSNSTYHIAIYNDTAGGTIVARETGNGITVALDPSASYRVACVVLSGTSIDETFKPRVRTGKVLNLMRPRSSAIFGPMFVWTTGDNVHVYVNNSTRFLYKGVVQSSLQGTHTILDMPSSGALVYDGVQFSVVNMSNVTSDMYCLGFVYSNWFYPSEPRIIANSIPISEIKQHQDVEMHINFDRLGYVMAPYPSIGLTDGKIKWFGDGFSVKNGYSLSPRNLYTIYPLFYFDTTFTQNTSNLSGKHILTIGDSITNRGWYQSRILEHAPNAVFVGTHECQHANIMAEGYSGTKVSYILGASSPFYNPITSKFDFDYYCTTNDIDVDIVIIEYGLNETDGPVDFNQQIQEIIDSINDYDPNINVFVCVPFRMSLGPFANGLGAVMNRYVNIRKLANGCTELTDCELIPTHITLNDKYDYEPAEIPYGYGDITLDGTNDPVHPSESVGFKKLGDIIYNYIH